MDFGLAEREEGVKDPRMLANKARRERLRDRQKAVRRKAQREAREARREERERFVLPSRGGQSRA